MSRSLLFWRTRMDLVCILRVFVARRIAEKSSQTLTSAKKLLGIIISDQIRVQHLVTLKMPLPMEAIQKSRRHKMTKHASTSNCKR